MNVAALLQDSPSDDRRRPTAVTADGGMSGNGNGNGNVSGNAKVNSGATTAPQPPPSPQWSRNPSRQWTDPPQNPYPPPASVSSSPANLSSNPTSSGTNPNPSSHRDHHAIVKAPPVMASLRPTTTTTAESMPGLTATPVPPPSWTPTPPPGLVLSTPRAVDWQERDLQRDREQREKMSIRRLSNASNTSISANAPPLVGPGSAPPFSLGDDKPNPRHQRLPARQPMSDFYEYGNNNSNPNNATRSRENSGGGQSTIASSNRDRERERDPRGPMGSLSRRSSDGRERERERGRDPGEDMLMHERERERDHRNLPPSGSSSREPRDPERERIPDRDRERDYRERERDMGEQRNFTNTSRDKGRELMAMEMMHAPSTSSRVPPLPPPPQQPKSQLEEIGLPVVSLEKDNELMDKMRSGSGTSRPPASQQPKQLEGPIPTPTSVLPGPGVAPPLGPGGGPKPADATHRDVERERIDRERERDRTERERMEREQDRGWVDRERERMNQERERERHHRLSGGHSGPPGPPPPSSGVAGQSHGGPQSPATDKRERDRERDGSVHAPHPRAHQHPHQHPHHQQLHQHLHQHQHHQHGHSHQHPHQHQHLHQHHQHNHNHNHNPNHTHAHPHSHSHSHMHTVHSHPMHSHHPSSGQGQGQKGIPPTSAGGSPPSKDMKEPTPPSMGMGMVMKGSVGPSLVVGSLMSPPNPNVAVPSGSGTATPNPNPNTSASSNPPPPGSGGPQGQGQPQPAPQKLFQTQFHTSFVAAGPPQSELGVERERDRNSSRVNSRISSPVSMAMGMRDPRDRDVSMRDVRDARNPRERDSRDRDWDRDAKRLPPSSNPTSGRNSALPHTHAHVQLPPHAHTLHNPPSSAMGPASSKDREILILPEQVREMERPRERERDIRARDREALIERERDQGRGGDREKDRTERTEREKFREREVVRGRERELYAASASSLKASEGLGPDRRREEGYVSAPGYGRGSGRERERERDRDREREQYLQSQHFSQPHHPHPPGHADVMIIDSEPHGHMHQAHPHGMDMAGPPMHGYNMNINPDLVHPGHGGVGYGRDRNRERDRDRDRERERERERERDRDVEMHDASHGHGLAHRMADDGRPSSRLQQQRPYPHPDDTMLGPGQLQDASSKDSRGGWYDTLIDSRYDVYPQSHPHTPAHAHAQLMPPPPTQPQPHPRAHSHARHPSHPSTATAAVVNPPPHPDASDMLDTSSTTEWGEGDEVLDMEEETTRAKVVVNLGTYVYPRLPFPYFFDLGSGLVGMKEREEERERREKERVERERKEAARRERREREREKEKEWETERVEKERREREEKDKMEKEKAKESGVEVKEDISKMEDGEIDEELDREKEKVKNEEKAKEAEKDKENFKDSQDSKLDEKPNVPCPLLTDRQPEPEPPQPLMDMETRTTIVIPSGHIPTQKPIRPRLWGGGAYSLRSRPPPTRNNRKTTHPSNAKTKSPANASSLGPTKKLDANRRSRRIYTDDSDLFLCAVHSGWITWTGASRAREQGRDIRIELRVIRAAGAGPGSVFARGVGGLEGQTTDGGRIKEEIIGRFLGGFGERCFNPLGRTGSIVGEDLDVDGVAEGLENGIGIGVALPLSMLDDPDDDGRGLVSAAWGSGHDGSAIEIINVEFISRGTPQSARGLSKLTRSQRLLEYTERRLNILASPCLPCLPTRNITGSRKRRRGWDAWPVQPRRLPNASVLEAIQESDEDEFDQSPPKRVKFNNKEEEQLMDVRTLVFGIGAAGEVSLGFKYVPSTLKEMLFPSRSSQTDQTPPRKRLRLSDTEDVDMFMSVDSEDVLQPQPQTRPVILETTKESYLLSLSTGSSASAPAYDIALVLEAEVVVEEEQGVPGIESGEGPAAAGMQGSVAEAEMKDASPARAGSTTPRPDDIDVAPTAEGDPTKISPTSPSPAPTPAADPESSSPPPSSMPPSSPPRSVPARTRDKTPTILDDDLLAKPPFAVQVLQKGLTREMFRFMEEGVYVRDGSSVTASAVEGVEGESNPGETEWVIQIKDWKWAGRERI